MYKLQKYRISKYNPLFRNDEGHYTKNEWTEFTDIGKIYDNIIFTYEEYLKIESKYINAILYIIKELRLKNVTLVGLNIYSNNENNENIEPELLHIIDELDLFNGSICVTIEELSSYLKLNFRDLINFDVVIDNTNIITFGYDFYMYYHTKISENEFDKIKESIENIGLFVD